MGVKAKQLNPQIGWVACSECGARSTLHRMRRGTRGLYYYNCPDCGCIQPTREGAQDRIAARAEFWPEHKPAGQGETKPPPPAPSPRPTKPARAGGLLGALWSRDDD